MALGTLHAFAPGHGKTVMAAYMVSVRGSVRQAAAISATVTATHTAGVLVLGLIISASTAIGPERIYPWLGSASGILLTIVGVNLLRTRARVRAAAGKHEHEHEHEHGQDHEHAAAPRSRSLIAMGFAGGLVPSPSALVVLLGAIALHRAWFGVVLVICYGAGMAATLTAAGLLLARGRRRLDARPRGSRTAALARALPVAAAGAVVASGLFVAARGFAAI